MPVIGSEAASLRESSAQRANSVAAVHSVLVRTETTEKILKPMPIHLFVRIRLWLIGWAPSSEDLTIHHFVIRRRKDGKRDEVYCGNRRCREWAGQRCDHQ